MDSKNTDILVVHSCSCCGKLAKKRDLPKCARCKVSRYCSKACQQKAWPEHKTLCKADRSVADKSNTAILTRMSNAIPQLSLMAQALCRKYWATGQLMVGLQYIGEDPNPSEQEVQKQIEDAFEMFGTDEVDRYTTTFIRETGPGEMIVIRAVNKLHKTMQLCFLQKSDYATEYPELFLHACAPAVWLSARCGKGGLPRNGLLLANRFDTDQ
jgi:hypothetical protein